MQYSISEITKRYKITARTLRYDEEAGLVESSREEGRAYRVYTEEQIERLELILFMRRLTFSIGEISEVLSGSDTAFRPMLEARIKRSNLQLQQEKETNAILHRLSSMLSKGGPPTLSDLLRELPYISKRIEEIMPMKKIHEEKYRIALGIEIVMGLVNENEGNLLEKIRLLRADLPSLPMLRVYDSPDLRENEVLIVWDGRHACRFTIESEDYSAESDRIIAEIRALA